MITATAVLSIGVFICMFRMSGVMRVGTGVLVTVQGAVAAMRDDSLDEKTREKELQRASLQLLGAFLSILTRSVLTLLASLLPIWLGDLLGLVKIEEVISYLSRLDVITIATVLIVFGYVIWFRLRPSSTAAIQMNYSALDRLLHRIAFVSPTTQITAADIEKKVFGGVFESVKAERPIFITSLPRAGTTILLEALCRFPSVATHIYRDMPFVMSPLLWSQLSRAFHKRSELRERAHGDGMQFGYDSPEAFEEILWRTFWPEKYHKDYIDLWGPEDDKKEASEFFHEHFKKIIALRVADRKRDGRYMSKNNANIARLDMICKMFDQAHIIVPVRNPIEHATSLLRQHFHFSEMHKTNTFTRQYMEDIGHYEFGDLHRPIAFPGYESSLSNKDPLTIDYWLAYWTLAFEYLLARRERVIFISYEHICLDAKRTLANLCEQLDIRTEDALEEAASLFREPSPPKGDKLSCDSRLIDQAVGLYNCIIL